MRVDLSAADQLRGGGIVDGKIWTEVYEEQRPSRLYSNEREAVRVNGRAVCSVRGTNRLPGLRV